MNKRDMDVLLAITRHGCTAQRELAELCDCSLGSINASIRRLIQEGYLTEQMQQTTKTAQRLRKNAPKRAVLLAAGFGLQQSLHYPAIPKALLEVNGQRLIDRIISQLHQTGITEIYVVVGFAKEQFEYLIDRYGVKLIVNPEYIRKNNLHSLALARAYLQNCYVVPCDLWCQENPFRKQELYSWYMVSTEQCPESPLRVNRKQELVTVSADALGDRMIGISYLTEDESVCIATRLAQMDTDSRYKGAFWEETLYDGDRFLLMPQQVAAHSVVEINTPEQLRELNDHSAALAVKEISQILGVPESQIQSLTPVKRGMTNTSYFFRCDDRSYSIRIPTGKTDNLIDREREADIYRLLADHHIAETVYFFDPATGIKLSGYIENARACDPANSADVAACMQRLRQFHNCNLQTEHSFDLFKAIEFYESLWDGDSLYQDYQTTKQQVFSLQSYITRQQKDCCLTHLDAVPENFLISSDNTIHLIDWEYAAMQDPHMDIAMFCLQALYDRAQTDAAIDAYFPEGCPQSVRLKIYCYMAAGGLLWSNWCEYEIRHGAEFGAYSLQQYRYAKEYYRLVENECYIK